MSVPDIRPENMPGRTRSVTGVILGKSGKLDAMVIYTDPGGFFINFGLCFLRMDMAFEA